MKDRVIIFDNRKKKETTDNRNKPKPDGHIFNIPEWCRINLGGY